MNTTKPKVHMKNAWMQTVSEFSSFLKGRKKSEIEEIARDLQARYATTVHMFITSKKIWQYFSFPQEQKHPDQNQEIEKLQRENTDLVQTIVVIQEAQKTLQEQYQSLQQENQWLQEKNTILTVYLKELHHQKHIIHHSPEHKYFYEQYIYLCDQIPINNFELNGQIPFFTNVLSDNMDAHTGQEKEVRLALWSIAYWWCVFDNKKFLELYDKKTFPKTKIAQQLVNFIDRVCDISNADKVQSINWEIMRKIRGKMLTKDEQITFVTTPGAIFMKNPFISEKKEYIYPPLEKKFQAFLKTLPF